MLTLCVLCRLWQHELPNLNRPYNYDLKRFIYMIIKFLLFTGTTYIISRLPAPKLITARNYMHYILFLNDYHYSSYFYFLNQVWVTAIIFVCYFFSELLIFSCILYNAYETYTSPGYFAECLCNFK